MCAFGSKYNRSLITPGIFFAVGLNELLQLFPLNSFSLTMALNTSLSTLREHQIPGKLRKKSYVHGSLLSSKLVLIFCWQE